MNAFIALFIGRLIAASICAVMAGQIALAGKDGWGWFLVAAVALGCVSYESKNGSASG